jgi:hypothetical protein
MVIHQFPSPGFYHAGIHRSGRVVADTQFRVDAESGVMQLDIDLAEAAQRHPTKGDCGCTGKGEKTPVVSPKGYVLFHASSGDGYSVTAAAEDQKVVFDSTKLGGGDLFATSLLEPGKYIMENTLGRANGEILVTLTPEDAKRINQMEPQHVSVSADQFEPPKLTLVSSQGLVFRVNGEARIVINREGEREPFRPQKPILRWQKPVSSSKSPTY